MNFFIKRTTRKISKDSRLIFKKRVEATRIAGCDLLKRIVWLKEHVQRFAAAETPIGKALWRSWSIELAEKRMLLHDWAAGRLVSQAPSAR